MADNVNVTEGSGKTVASDDVSGAQYQRIKVDLGGDGVSSPLVRGQQSSANSIPSVLSTEQEALLSAMLPSTAAASAIAPSATTVAASSKVLKGSAGNLYGFNGVSGASAGYFLLYDLMAAPANGTVTPAKVYAVGANTSLDVSYTPPLRMATGITVAFSTTGPFTQTLSATAFISGEAV